MKGRYFKRALSVVFGGLVIANVSVVLHQYQLRENENKSEIVASNNFQTVPKKRIEEEKTSKILSVMSLSSQLVEIPLTTQYSHAQIIDELRGEKVLGLDGSISPFEYSADRVVVAHIDEQKYELLGNSKYRLNYSYRYVPLENFEDSSIRHYKRRLSKDDNFGYEAKSSYILDLSDNNIILSLEGGLDDI